MKKLIILDIDGVIKPFTSARTLLDNPENDWFEGKTQSGKFYLVCFNKKRWLKFFNDLMSSFSGDDELIFMWGSAWAEDSNTILDILGFEKHWEHIPLIREDVGLGTWKFKSILPVIESINPDRIVWVDDELEGDVFDYAEQRGNMLTIAPERYEALTDKHMEEIISFLRAN